METKYETKYYCVDHVKRAFDKEIDRLQRDSSGYLDEITITKLSVIEFAHNKCDFEMWADAIFVENDLSMKHHKCDYPALFKVTYGARKS